MRMILKVINSLLGIFALFVGAAQLSGQQAVSLTDSWAGIFILIFLLAQIANNTSNNHSLLTQIANNTSNKGGAEGK